MVLWGSSTERSRGERARRDSGSLAGFPQGNTELLKATSTGGGGTQLLSGVCLNGLTSAESIIADMDYHVKHVERKKKKTHLVEISDLHRFVAGSKIHNIYIFP